MITTHLFERSNLLREGLKGFLSGTAFSVTAEYGCMSECKVEDAAIAPDLIITGMNNATDTASGDLPMMFAELANQIKSFFPEAKLVVLASEEEMLDMPELRHCVADGYILPDTSREAMLHYLNLAMIGEKALPERVALIFASLMAVSDQPLPLKQEIGGQSLSDRESDIVECLMLGESNKMIARNLDITESTVKVHLKTILRKLGVQNRTQIALMAVKEGSNYFRRHKMNNMAA